MRYILGIAIAALIITGTPQANATVGDAACNICTCQNEAVICLDLRGTDILEEQGICGGPCAEVNSTFKSSEIIEAACEDLPACDHAETPAASALWLSAGMLGLLLIGAAKLRRIGGRTQH